MKRLVIITLAVGLTSAVSPPLDAQIATQNEADIVARNWIAFILQRDGYWADSTAPFLAAPVEFRRGDRVLGYLFAVEPRGYVLVSSLTDFAPIKAYSTTSALDPDHEVGMCALLKDVLNSRQEALLRVFGGLDADSLRGLRAMTPEHNRLAWDILLAGGADLPEELGAVSGRSRGVLGPLLRSSWHQDPPYNNDCPAMGCDWYSYGYFNTNACVGCVPLAMAQIMRYYCWPPHYGGQHYDWPNMLDRYVYDGAGWFNDPAGNPVTWAQIDAVADLCADAGETLEDWVAGCGIDYGCGETTAAVCNFWCNDARDAFEDYFYFGRDGEMPDCEDRADYDSDWDWLEVIKRQIDWNRPVLYRISNDEDFRHAIVVDGYDDTGGQPMAHANYGWDNGNNDWYVLDHFYCDPPGCDLDEEYMVRCLFPLNGLCEERSGFLYPQNDEWTIHYYAYCNTASDDLTVEGGAWLQFLPGVSLSCFANEVNIYGRGPDLGETRFFTGGDATRGLLVGNGGEVRLLPGGIVRLP